MKIHNKGKGWSFFGKALLWSTALIFVSCGFNTQKKENSNIADFVDFIDLGLSVEEKEEPTFGLAGGFNLVAEGLNCKKIDYSWEDSASGYNPNEEAQPIEKVKFIDKDQFTFKLDALRCTLGNNSNIATYTVKTSGVNYTFTSGEVRIYEAVGQNLADIEITQEGDCINEACTSGSSISFTLKTFQLEDGSEDVGATSFQEEISISFAAASAVPPVAIKSSIIKTLSSSSIESL